MIKVLFVCHGNICRSPMAEFLLKDMVKKKGIEDMFEIASAATSREEIGNPVHPEVKKILARVNISCNHKQARQMKYEDYKHFDYLLVMDKNNLRNVYQIINGDTLHKVYRLLDFTNHPCDIADPWYTDNFELTYQQITHGCNCFLDYVLKKQKAL
ncbi:MAG: low molecular weight protein-tyrosine-phosphatase [Traorella sp.]